MGSNYAPYIGKSLYNSTLRLAVFGMLILSSFFLFNACNKEALIDDENPSDLISYNWGEKERSFFNFSNVSSLFREKVGLSYRNTSDTLPQLLVDAYNQLALENETHNFAERLFARIGVPFWSYSYVNVDESIEGGLIITPVGFVEGNKTTALLIASKSNQYPDNKFDFKLVLRIDIEKTIRDQNFTERPNLLLEIGHLIYADINIYNTVENNYMNFVSANETTLKKIYNTNKLSYRDCVIYKFEHCFGIVVPYGENIEGSNNEGDTSGSVDWGGFGWRQDNNGGWTIPDKPGGEGVITPYIENFWKTFFDLYIRNLWQPNMVIERKDVQNKDNKTKLNSQQDKINLRGGNEDCWIFYIKKCSNENGLFEEVLMDEQEQCEMALENFIYQYDLTLSQTEIDSLQQNIPSYFCYESKEYNQAAINLLAHYKHDELLSKYPEYVASSVNIDNFIAAKGSKAYLASAILFEAFMEEINNPPDDPYQWQLMMEVFQAELLPILLEFTPGIGDLIGSYNDFQEGNYFWGCVGIVSSIIPGDEVIKVIRKSDNIRDAWRKVNKVITLWNKLFTLTGGQKILNKMPQSWKDLPGSKLASNSGGLIWQKDIWNHFRLMEPVPESSVLNKRVPYSRFVKNSKYLSLNNKWVYKENGKFFEEGIEITSQQFEELSHIPIVSITDSILNKFFD